MLAWFKRKLKEMIKDSLREIIQEEKGEKVDHFASSEGINEPIPEEELVLSEQETEDFMEETEDEEYVKDWEKTPIEEVTPTGSPRRYVNLSDNTLTVILASGEGLTTNQGTKEMYRKVLECTTEEEIRIIMIPNYLEMKAREEQERKFKEERERKQRELEEKQRLKNEKLRASFETLLATGDFEVIDDSVYAKGIARSLPPLLLEKFGEIAHNRESVEYTSLLRFWYWCCLNPRAQVANLLYGFLQKNCLRLNPQGFFYALRNVVTVKGVDTSLVQFVSSSYNHIKAVWKKKPINYEVFKDKNDKYMFAKIKDKDDHSMTLDNTYIGNLAELYKDLPNMDQNRYTDNYTGTFDIRVGKVVTMPPEECNWSVAECGTAGLHFTLDEINYVGCGDTSVMILINPMKVVGIGTQKGRCWEYFPIMTVPRTEVTQLLHDKDFDTLQLDEVYAQHEIDELERKVKSGFTKENQKYRYADTKVTDKEAEVVVDLLSKIRQEIGNKVVEVS